MSAGTGWVDEQWREPLHPTVDHDVIDLDAPLSQQLFNVAGESVTQIPANRNHDLAGSGTPRSWTSMQTLDEGDDASTKPARSCSPLTQQTRSTSR